MTARRKRSEAELMAFARIAAYRREVKRYGEVEAERRELERRRQRLERVRAANRAGRRPVVRAPEPTLFDIYPNSEEIAA